MSLLSQDELNPLQAARRVAEEHLDTIRQIYNTRANARAERRYDEDEENRLSKIFDVSVALESIYDAVSELEFEEEPPEEPEPSVPEEDEEPEPDDDEDEDEDPDEDEE